MKEVWIDPTRNIRAWFTTGEKQAHGEHFIHVDEVRKVIEAWESLPGSRRYSPAEIEDWLVNDMAPVINELRKLC